MVFGIFVRSKYLKKVLELDISDDTTGLQLKKMIKKHTGININRQRLTMLDFPINDKESISDQGFIISPPYSIKLDVVIPPKIRQRKRASPRRISSKRISRKRPSPKRASIKRLHLNI